MEIKVCEPGSNQIGQPSFNKANRSIIDVEFMPPEVISGGKFSPDSDIWSVGCLLYQLMTFKKPFAARSFFVIVDQINSGKFSPIKQNYSDALKKTCFCYVLHRSKK